MAKGINTWALTHMTWDYIQRMQEDIERMERTIGRNNIGTKSND